MTDARNSQMFTDVGAVVIGRNEGERLRLCLQSLVPLDRRVVYVDSGSTDHSIDIARDQGVEILELDSRNGFTAARARNAGLDRLSEIASGLSFVQFVDGDCEVRGNWLAEGAAFLRSNPDVAVVCGRRRERNPQMSLWNRLIDREWDTPIGSARACGGDAMMRLDALREVGGFDGNLIAGEEPELCFRLRAAGWKIWRLDAEMTIHDAAMTRFGQWWKRSKRAGFAYAEGAHMHGRSGERYNVRETRRALLWGAALPFVAVLGAVLYHPGVLAILLAWPAQMARLTIKGEDPARALFLTLGKFPEAQGVVAFYLASFFGRRRGLIEYK